jgi:LDH2 family malate/lactate/ureidoglycolate dehydrogenase
MENLIQFNVLNAFCKDVFKQMGCSEEHSKTAADVLLAADLSGIDSHGLARLSGYYRLFEKNIVNVKPNLHIIYESPGTATLNADAALGLIAAQEAMRIAIEKAKVCGTGWVAVQNSNHFGIAAYHAMMALEHDMIGIAMTNASPLVAAVNTKERLLGTNPMAYAIPAAKQKPFVADFATTTAANGKLEILQRKNQEAPLGWIIDQDGNPTKDANALKSGGALLPLGSDAEHGIHKGFCLGAVVDIFSAVLSGANYGPWVPPFVSFLAPKANPVGKGIGHFFGAMRVDAFRPADEFKAHMDNWIETFLNIEPIDGSQKITIPGWPEMETAQYRREHGIPLNNKVYEDLLSLSEKLGIALK